MQKMRLKRFSVVSAPAKMADMANTMDAAPRRPAPARKKYLGKGSSKGPQEKRHNSGPHNEGETYSQH